MFAGGRGGAVPLRHDARSSRFCLRVLLHHAELLFDCGLERLFAGNITGYNHPGSNHLFPSHCARPGPGHQYGTRASHHMHSLSTSNKVNTTQKLCSVFLVPSPNYVGKSNVLAAWWVGSKHGRLNLQTWNPLRHADRHGMRAKEISVVTVSKLGNSSGEWLRTEHTPVTEPETAKHDTSQRCIPCQFQMGRVPL